MTWNYRITKDKDGYSLREVYYDGDDIGWTEEPITYTHDTPEELLEDLRRQLDDAERSKNDILEI